LSPPIAEAVAAQAVVQLVNARGVELAAVAMDKNLS
jgi:hypothetical protein